MCNTDPIKNALDDISSADFDKFSKDAFQATFDPIHAMENVKNLAERDLDLTGDVLTPKVPAIPPQRDIAAENLAARQEATRTANSSKSDRRRRSRRSSLSTSSAGLGSSSLSSQTQSTLG